MSFLFLLITLQRGSRVAGGRGCLDNGVGALPVGKEWGVVTEACNRRRDIRLSTSGGPYQVSFRFQEQTVSHAVEAHASVG